MRTTPVEVGTVPYDWNSKYTYECTWFAYYRCGEADKSMSYPCWWDRATQTGSYTDAKDWLKNYRDPWEVKDPDYIPVENDIVVFDGPLGHVAFIEKVEGNTAILSQYKNGDINSFSNYAWKIGTDYTGPVLGYLHYPYGTVETVDRNTAVDQIETLDITLRIREKPSLDGTIVGHVQLGYYNVLDRKEADGYTWYKLANNRWCADIETKYLPGEGEDIIKELERYFDSMKEKVNVLTDENAELKEDMGHINAIAESWL